MLQGVTDLLACIKTSMQAFNQSEMQLLIRT